MVLESLIPALRAEISGQKLPSHVKNVEADGITQVKLIDATPIGINVRSTVATYANVHDGLRKVYARTADAKEHHYKAGDFHTTQGNFAVLPVTAQARFHWMSSFCRTFRFPVPTAGAPGTEKKPMTFTAGPKMERNTACRNL